MPNPDGTIDTNIWDWSKLFDPTNLPVAPANLSGDPNWAYNYNKLQQSPYGVIGPGAFSVAGNAGAQAANFPMRASGGVASNFQLPQAPTYGTTTPLPFNPPQPDYGYTGKFLAPPFPNYPEYAGTNAPQVPFKPAPTPNYPGYMGSAAPITQIVAPPGAGVNPNEPGMGVGSLYNASASNVPFVNNGSVIGGRNVGGSGARGGAGGGGTGGNRAPGSYFGISPQEAKWKAAAEKLGLNWDTVKSVYISPPNDSGSYGKSGNVNTDVANGMDRAVDDKAWGDAARAAGVLTGDPAHDAIVWRDHYNAHDSSGRLNLQYDPLVGHNDAIAQYRANQDALDQIAKSLGGDPYADSWYKP